MTRAALVAIVVAFLTGAMTGIVVVENYAPTHPDFFCRPAPKGQCVPFPWTERDRVK